MNRPRRSDVLSRVVLSPYVPSRVLLVVTLLLMGTGCAVIPQFGPPDIAGPPVPASDTTRVEIPDPETWDKVEQEPEVTPRQTPKREPTRTVENTAPATEDLVPVDQDLPKVPTETETPPSLTVLPPSDELERIETETISGIAEAKQLLESVDSEKLGADDHDKYLTIRGLIEQANQAYERQDLDAAARLAKKARLLAVELTSR